MKERVVSLMDAESVQANEVLGRWTPPLRGQSVSPSREVMKIDHLIRSYARTGC